MKAKISINWEYASTLTFDMFQTEFYNTYAAHYTGDALVNKMKSDYENNAVKKEQSDTAGHKGKPKPRSVTAPVNPENQEPLDGE